MKLHEYNSDFQLLLDHASKLLGAEARPLQMAWVVQYALEGHMIRRDRSGINTESPVVLIKEGRRGHQVTVGIQVYGLQTRNGEMRLAKVSPPDAIQLPGFWAVRADDYLPFYRFVRERLKDAREDQVEPIMQPSERTRLWENTLGFLRRDSRELKRFNVPQKRGVLLSGEPGNGKTMACRWLNTQCERLGLDWETVTVDEYEDAKRTGDVRWLFQPDGCGVVLFDDFDTALRDRNLYDNQREQSTFLAEMDGMCPKVGVVYLFTSNLKANELDSAFRRPGRIDTIIDFPKPDSELRRTFIRRQWHSEIVEGINVEEIVSATAGFSFAELEELKKQIVLRYLDTGQFDWEAACRALDEHKDLVETRRPIGFCTEIPLEETVDAVTVASTRD